MQRRSVKEFCMAITLQQNMSMMKKHTTLHDYLLQEIMAQILLQDLNYTFDPVSNITAY